MTDTKELNTLINQAEALGAVVTVTYDQDALIDEGRHIHETIQVTGLAGIGPYPMSPIAAAESLRRALSFFPGFVAYDTFGGKQIFVTSGPTIEATSAKARAALKPEYHSSIQIVPIADADLTTRRWYGLNV